MSSCADTVNEDLLKELRNHKDRIRTSSDRILEVLLDVVENPQTGEPSAKEMAFTQEVSTIIDSLSWIGSIARNKENFHGAIGLIRIMSTSCNSLFRESRREGHRGFEGFDMKRLTYENARNTRNTINGVPNYGIPSPTDGSAQESSWNRYKREIAGAIVVGIVSSIVYWALTSS